ncbi:MAG: uncharacterized membrane protein YhaH (DUF805 family) [Patiriisocius sp.]|jgi:uncharacterized membrane protein YhaH (DUF805 family)
MHWFIDPIQNKYADFTGRTSRKEYWMFILVYLLIYIPLTIVTEMLGVPLVATLCGLVIVIPSLAIAARRLHDIGRSGWWQLISLIPLLGTIILIVWLATESGEDNQYGAGVHSEDVPAPTPENGMHEEEVSTEQNQVS